MHPSKDPAVKISLTDNGPHNTKIPLAVSACLTGECCTYKGTHHQLDCLDELEKYCTFIKICPETQGGLTAPRLPAEIQGNQVCMSDGTDVTEAFMSGAQEALKCALENNCVVALLKERSPSCGFGTIYDGTFSSTLVEGNGVGAQLLHNAGIPIYGESRVKDLISDLRNKAF